MVKPETYNSGPRERFDYDETIDGLEMFAVAVATGGIIASHHDRLDTFKGLPSAIEHAPSTPETIPFLGGSAVHSMISNPAFEANQAIDRLRREDLSLAA